ncbi:MAG: hypothetical protein COY40_04675 [Alphaproteobacteria bacterium CG_4_10_14_0_8_um_filter_53_9]|nr:MAG: hypothetical protein COY40_04675 [Alphaproteobacteria bacterium CG_4_10_14_0_8_um_filter_53_9]
MNYGQTTCADTPVRAVSAPPVRTRGVRTWRFDARGGLPQGCTFSRASTATRFDENGDLVDVPTGQVRAGFDPLGTGFKGYILEPQRTNLIPYSAASTAHWTLILSPTLTNLSLNALRRFDGLKVASGGAISSAAKSGTYTANRGEAYALRFYYKAGTSGKAYATWGGDMSLSGPVGALAVSFTHTAIGLTVSDLVNTDFGGGIYAVSCVVRTTGTGTINSYLSFGPSTSVAGEDVILLGAQCEVGDYPTSYIPTSGAAGTRAAEAFTLTMPFLTNGLFYSSASATDVSLGNFSQNEVMVDSLATRSATSFYAELG